jgi:hypothetical protein
MRWYRALVVSCLVAGAVLRARGFLFGVRPFWVDEAAWTTRLLETSLLEPSIRPVGFTAATRLLVACFGAREDVLRLIPWLAGMGALFLTVPLAEALLPTPGTRLLLIGTLAFHPVAIDYCKEFKPYSSSLCLHVTAALFVVRYLADGRTRTLSFALLTGFLGVWFAQDLIFALPGLYLVTGAFAWRNARRSELTLLVAGAVATIALIVLLYFFFWRAVDVGIDAKDTGYWGKKYDVFHHPGTDEGFLAWVARKWVELGAFPAARREHWLADHLLPASGLRALSAAYAGLWVILHATGIVVLLRERRFAVLTLLGAPILTVLAFNLLGLWPFAVFRTNLFLLAYVAPIAAFGAAPLEALVQKLPRSVPAFAAAPLAVAVALPLVFERDWHEHKYWAGESDFFDVANALVAMQGKHHRGKRQHPHTEPLVLDHWACEIFHYYLQIDPDYEELGRTFGERFETKCARAADGLHEAEREAKQGRVWLVVSNPQQSRSAREKLANLANVIKHRELNDGRDLLLELGPSDQKTQ